MKLKRRMNLKRSIEMDKVKKLGIGNIEREGEEMKSRKKKREWWRNGMKMIERRKIGDIKKRIDRIICGEGSNEDCFEGKRFWMRWEKILNGRENWKRIDNEES